MNSLYSVTAGGAWQRHRLISKLPSLDNRHLVVFHSHRAPPCGAVQTRRRSRTARMRFRQERILRHLGACARAGVDPDIEHAGYASRTLPDPCCRRANLSPGIQHAGSLSSRLDQRAARDRRTSSSYVNISAPASSLRPHLSTSSRLLSPPLPTHAYRMSSVKDTSPWPAPSQ